MIGNQRKAEADFISWLNANGCMLENVAWPSFSSAGTGMDNESERGVIALKSVPKYGVIFSLPFELIITVEAALKSSSIIGSIFNDENIRKRFPSFVQNESRILTVFLVCHRFQQKDSKWRHYIATLPEQTAFCDFLDEWTEEELVGLADNNIALLCRGCKAEIRNNFRDFVNILRSDIIGAINPAKLHFLEKSSDTLFQEYRWAYWIVESRAFMDRFCGDYSKPCLLPFADMLNHCDKVTDSAEFKVDSKTGQPICFELHASRDIMPGNSVYNSYGNRNNNELLLKYGFVIKNNIWESVRISLPWVKHSNHNSDLSLFSVDRLLEKKKMVVDQFGNPQSQELFLRAVPSLECLFFFRLWTCSDIDSLKKCQQNGMRNPVSLSLEIKTLKNIKYELDRKISAISAKSELGQNVIVNQKRTEITRVFNETKLNILRSHRAFCEENLDLLTNLSNNLVGWEVYCGLFH
uniref:SET domain-containing protein n=1 Tax=Aplanochytrium stocchinoi TaxID=215587 RepID=A0A7S3PNL6_9STRA